MDKAEKAAAPVKIKPATETKAVEAKSAAVVIKPVPEKTAEVLKPVEKLEAKPEAKAIATVSQADGLALAKKNNCLACHAIDHKVVGPAWKDVAVKYKGDAAAEAKLIAKVSKGGAGVWGSMPMPANDAAGKKQDEIKKLVQFVLGLSS